MPYIKQNRRDAILRGYDDRFEGPENVGELNFNLTYLIKEYIDDKGLSYGTLNAVIGVLECAKLELYRRLAAPYEDGKIIENGDVY